MYPEGTAAQFANSFDPAYGRLASRVAPTVGNHEAWEVASGYDPYWNDVEGAALPPFYAFDAAGWQILSLNSEIDHAAGSRQIRWLEKATRAPGTCRIAFWHRPRFSAGTVHPGDEDVASFWNVLAGRAVAVVNGHAHSMQRFAPADGLTQFIAGTGGRDLHPLRPEPPPELAFGEDREYGALRLELAPGGAAYAFVAADGRVLDAGHLRCVDLTRQPGGA